MPLPKIADVRAFTDEELETEILDVKKQLFDLRFQKATRQEIKSHEFKHARHRLAQLLTIERERQLAELADEEEPVDSSEVTPAAENVVDEDSEED